MLHVLGMLLVSKILSDPTFWFAWLVVQLRNSLQLIVGKFKSGFAYSVSLVKEIKPLSVVFITQLTHLSL